MRADQPVDVSKLIPLVRSRFHHELTKLQLTVKTPSEASAFVQQHAFKIFASHLAVSVAVDHLSHYEYLTRDDLQELGVSFEQALETAKRNLAGDANRLPNGIRFDSMPEGLYFPDGEMGDHNSALVLYTDAIRQLPLDGAPILFVPHSDMFWVTGSYQSDAVALLCGMTLQEIYDRPQRPITTIPFVLVGDQWQPWQPDCGDPCYQHVRELHVRHDEMAYAAQGNLLQQQYASSGRDVHVAKYRTATHIDLHSVAHHHSVTVWTETVPTMLPRTDFVCLQRLLNRRELDRGESVDPEFGESIYVPWKSLQRLKSTPRPQEMYPERYFAERSPDESTWRALQKDAELVPPELQQTLRMAQQYRPAAAATIGPKKRSPLKLVGIGCAVGFGGALLLALGLIAMIAIGNRFQPLRKRQVGEFEQLMPAHFAAIPSVDDFETGVIRDGQADAFPTVGDMPPFADLPAEVLAKISAPAAPFHETGFAGNVSKKVVKDRPPPGGVLVGLRMIKGQEWGGAIRSLQPIYQVGDHYTLGGRLGPDQGVEQIQYLAKPGYAVGAIRVQAGLALNAIQIEFHPATADHATAEPYRSQWFGCVGGAPFELTGGPFAGIDVSLVHEIVGIQLLSGNSEVK